MKTEIEVKQMLYEIQDKISVVQAKAQEAEYPSEAYSHYDKQYGRLVAQCNILLEVLNG